MNTQQALQLAFQHLNGGNLPAASQLFNSILQQEPQNFAALNGRGFVALQQNQLHQAQADLQSSLSINPKQAFAHKMLGIVLGAMRRFDESMAAFESAVALDARDPEVYFNRANFRFQAGQTQEALADLDAAIKLKGSYLEARSNRANLLIQQGDFARAEKDLDYLVNKVTNNPDIWVALGLARHKVGKHKESMQCNERALKLVPNHPDALLNSSSATYEQEEYPAALSWAEKAIAATPERAEAHYARAQAMLAMHRFEEAIVSYSRAIELNPAYAEAWMGLGLGNIRLLNFFEAKKALAHALSINGDDAAIWLNLGMVNAEIGEFDAAIEAYQKSIELNPSSAEAYNNLGLTMTMIKRYPEALEAYANSISIDPHGSAAPHNMSLAYLALGNYEDGWATYEARYRKPTKPRAYDKPLWLGNETIKDKVILLHAEQGLGDTLQFCRYANLVASVSRHVILLVPSSLKSICQSLVSNPEVYTDGETLPYFDFHCPLMSLPLAMATNVNCIPNQVPYLFADTSKVAFWKDKLSGVAKLKVGIVWKSGFQRNLDGLDGRNAGRNISLSRRDLDLCQLQDLMIPEISLISLQKGDRAEKELMAYNDSHAGHPPILDYVSELYDFSDTAALVEALDLVITVDTSVAHLAGALGKTTWLMCKYDSCWRWCFNDPQKSWYPNITIYRQKRLNDWTTVIDSVRNDLMNFL